MAFARIESIIGAGALDDRSRLFIVENSQYVLVNGLDKLEGCSIDGVDIPLEEARPMQQRNKAGDVDITFPEMPLLMVSDVPGVGRCLLRSEVCNNGEWQIGSRVVVAGQWEEVPGETFVSSTDATAEIAAKDARIAELEKQVAGQAADAKAKKDAEDKAGQAADAKAKKDAEDKAAIEAKKAADAKAKKDAEDKANGGA